MQPRVGVVCTTTRRASSGNQGDNYVLCADGRTSWLDGVDERSQRGEGQGVLVAVADGEADDAQDARTASTAVVRSLGKVWSGPAPAAPRKVLVDFLTSAHTRMYWKSRDRNVRMGASCAVAWVLDGRLHWAEVGTARVFLWREGQLDRLGTPWPAGDTQRFLGGSRGLGDDTALHLEDGRNCGSERLRAGDQVVLATDGFWTAVDLPSAAAILTHVTDAQTSAVTLMERALSRGARDSITAAVIDLR